ncbi:RnfH family protein [Salinicola sp. JS01]|uniref:RnfH family protein n=1 Tax=Salinicola sp. JS01 TaxID=3050071 RepID=UPI00255BDC62|nr:RnfH family protein [Salinicola sp. JS01]WIX33044.1 RnfH family protein [Salinicola sp. JS01]
MPFAADVSEVSDAEPGEAPVGGDALVEVAYATPTHQRIVTLAWSAGLTAREAVMRADLPAYFADLDESWLASAPLGIFGERLAQPEQRELLPGERVEVYRPLRIDPKQARRERAARRPPR